jgi:hypothetical protein
MWSAQSDRSAALAGQRIVELAVDEGAERLARHVDVFAAALDEIHRHVERVVDVALEADAVLEHEGSMPVRGSVSRPDVERNDRKPFGLPSVNGELANSAVATGCSASDTRSFFTMSASEEKSRLVCTVQVRYIMSRPSVPTFGM